MENKDLRGLRINCKPLAIAAWVLPVVMEIMRVVVCFLAGGKYRVTPNLAYIVEYVSVFGLIVMLIVLKGKNTRFVAIPLCAWLLIKAYMITVFFYTPPKLNLLLAVLLVVYGIILAIGCFTRWGNKAIKISFIALTVMIIVLQSMDDFTYFSPMLDISQIRYLAIHACYKPTFIGYIPLFLFSLSFLEFGKSKRTVSQTQPANAQ